MQRVWRTCQHCNSHIQIDLKDNQEHMGENDYCPMCNMNIAGDEKGKGIVKK